MNEFVNISASYLQTFDQNNKTITFSQSVCISCLQQNVAFINLSRCKHAFFFNFFYKYKEGYQNSVICHECHHFLKKIELFRQQVEESLVALNGQAQNIKPAKKFQDLLISNTQGDDASFKYEHDENEKCGNAQQDHYNDLTTEVKIEHESYSDFEIDVPLSQIKKEMKKVKKKKKKVKGKEVATKLKKPKKRSPLAEKYEGKISIITLSREEMLEEREREAKKQNYLKLPFKCESCITGFDHELTLKDHMEKRHGSKQGGYECNICKSILSTDISYKEHTKRHTRRYECQACGKRNNSIYSVIKHYNDQHGTIDTQFVCQECGFITDSHRSYRYHRDKHKQKQQCSLCDSTFVNNSGLRVHMFTVHKQSGRVYTCGTCGKSYSGRSGLAAHTAAAHSSHSALDAYCAQCKTHFKTPHNLAHHLRTHSKHVTTQQKRFICDECGVKFLTKGSLQEHIDFVHLKSSKHKCDKCSKVFINGSALKKHVNFVHEKIRPPRNKICDHCGRGFTTLSILECHVRTHTGARPLRCSRCPATFAHSAALYTHHKLIHKREPRGQTTHN